MGQGVGNRTHKVNGNRGKICECIAETGICCIEYNEAEGPSVANL